ncbi:MmgE/PrpD family protein [Burkholderia sp. b14]|nr:MmgE/PrpD family protein [Burkholderia sp. b14]
MSAPTSNVRSEPDSVLVDSLDYVQHCRVDSALALETVCYCLLDTLGCGLQALSYPACTKLPGRLEAADYEDEVARDARIDALTVELDDGTKFDEVVVEYPIGHPRRRADGISLLVDKFRANLARRFADKQRNAIVDVSLEPARLEGRCPSTSMSICT